VLQVIMVAAVVAYPQLVTGGIDKGTKLNAEDALQQLRDAGRGAMDARQGATPASGAAAPFDPMQELLDSMEKNKK
ncbi:MAG: C4-dicarboxylate ABC transporter, partial [Rubrivivax sp.]